jgi:hypothetical protein
MVYIKISDNAADDYLKMLYQIQRRERYLERCMGKRIPVDYNRKVMTLIKKLEALSGKKYKNKDIKVI